MNKEQTETKNAHQIFNRNVFAAFNGFARRHPFAPMSNIWSIAIAFVIVMVWAVILLFRHRWIDFFLLFFFYFIFFICLFRVWFDGDSAID